MTLQSFKKNFVSALLVIVQNLLNKSNLNLDYSHSYFKMKFKLSLQEYEKQLKIAKKKYDKLCKQYKRCKSAYQAEMISEDLEDTRQDVIELQIILNEIRQEKKLHECDPSQFVY